MSSWLLIDDSPEEAAAYAQSLADGDSLKIEHISVSDALTELWNGTRKPAGVLMDVDLSNEPGPKQTGPGLSQNIRVAQQTKTLPPFPIVRFSLQRKILENIGRDSSSDDIFDLKIEKDGLSNSTVRDAVRIKLEGIRKIYDMLEQREETVLSALGLNEENWILWGNSGFQYVYEMADRIHLRAAPLIRLLVHPGLLIEESILSFRLGIDREASAGWPAVLEALSCYNFRGVAKDFFPRWWARGIEQWWQDRIGATQPLSGMEIDQRVEMLSKHFSDLKPLTMPRGSMGKRPWRYCLLAMEQRDELIPIDPARAVRINPRSPMPSWLDPLYASLGTALQNRDDPRLDKSDLERLRLYTREN